MIKNMFLGLILLLCQTDCSIKPKDTQPSMKWGQGALASMLGNNHPWAGAWVLFWTGDASELLEWDDRGFTISQGGDWVITHSTGRYQIFNCMRQIDGSSYLYERLQGPRVGVVDRRSYVSIKLFSVSDDPEMLCDQLWRSRYFPTQDEANGAETNIPYASREPMARFWTRQKLEGFPCCYVTCRYLLHCFCRCKHREEPQQAHQKETRAPRASDMMDGVQPSKDKRRQRTRTISTGCECKGACNCTVKSAGDNKHAQPVTSQPFRRPSPNVVDQWRKLMQERKDKKRSSSEEGPTSPTDDKTEVINETKV